MSNSCQRDSEKARYEHFVTAANEALNMLKLTVQDRGINNNLEILFHRNNYEDIYEDHGNLVVQIHHWPDLITTSVHSARRAAGVVRTETWPQISLKRAHGEAASHFQWYDVLSAVELQCIAKINAEDVDAYRDGERGMITVPPHFVKMGPNSSGNWDALWRL